MLLSGHLRSGKAVELPSMRKALEPVMAMTLGLENTKNQWETSEGKGYRAQCKVGTSHI